MVNKLKTFFSVLVFQNKIQAWVALKEKEKNRDTALVVTCVGL